MYDSHTRRAIKPSGLLLVPMIDIFTVLVTFLLMTAVFARITVLNLDLDVASTDNSTPSEPEFRLEVIVRKDGLELTNGTATIAAIPNVAGGYDLETLSKLAVSLKRDYPQTANASVLLEPEVEYDSLVQVMDAIRSVDAASVAGAEALAQSGSGAVDAKPIRVDLFTDIAVGDAP
ncbi:MAG TPA: biopolymer transporter ExbD [Pseudomonadales bacterium]